MQYEMIKFNSRYIYLKINVQGIPYKIKALKRDGEVLNIERYTSKGSLVGYVPKNIDHYKIIMAAAHEAVDDLLRKGSYEKN